MKDYLKKKTDDQFSIHLANILIKNSQDSIYND